jgi:IclR family transcriptional regulator, pca regulon regulatory protein
MKQANRRSTRAATAAMQAGNVDEIERNEATPNEEDEQASAAAPAGDPNFMTSLERGLAVLQAFSQERRVLTTSQISQRTGIPRAAVRRCLYTLAKLGFVAEEDNRLFSLRPRVLKLGHGYLASTPLAHAAQPVLRHLSSTLNESSSVAILDGDDILYIARASTSRIMSIDLHIGSRLPAYCTSMGRVLLAQLSEQAIDAYLDRTKRIQYTARTIVSPDGLRSTLESVRANGYALVDQELEIGLRSIAVPIRTGRGELIAALSLSVATQRMSRDEVIARLLPELETARRSFAALL